MKNFNRRIFLKLAGQSTAAALAVSAVGLNCAKPKKRPNILFAISDDQSWAHTGAYGCKFVKTPAFDRVANDGVLFNNAFACAPQCSPNRASILTGRHIWQNEEAGTHASNFPKKLKVFTDELENAGYFIGTTGKSWGPGNWEITGWKRNPAGPEFNERKYEKAPEPGIRNTNYAANFVDFIEQKPGDKPFFFWYGSSEPHRSYKKGIGKERGKKIEDVTVPGFFPDDPEIRSDLLDYAVEIEWFDLHLEKILKILEEKGELENTLVVVTSDNGMPFPRAKANLYEYGIHMPLAVMWPTEMQGGRVVDDLISFTDYAPTFLQAAGTPIPEMMTGKSFMDLLKSKKSGLVDQGRTKAFSGRERHTHARPNNFAYPARSIRTPNYLYIWNVKPDRWPAGDPTGSGQPQGYHDIDGCPSKTFYLENQDKYPELTALALDKRPEEELYDIVKDKACLKNLAGMPDYQQIKEKLRKELQDTLKAQGDPRAFGSEIFESYPRYSSMRNFPGFKERGKYNPAYE
jgi:N-sulfoglucosamine sulfohydrolase